MGCTLCHPRRTGTPAPAETGPGALPGPAAVLRADLFETYLPRGRVNLPMPFPAGISGEISLAITLIFRILSHCNLQLCGLIVGTFS